METGGKSQSGRGEWGVGGGAAKHRQDNAERTEEEEEKGRRRMGRYVGRTGASACLWLNERPSWTDLVRQSALNSKWPTSCWVHLQDCAERGLKDGASRSDAFRWKQS